MQRKPSQNKMSSNLDGTLEDFLIKSPQSPMLQVIFGNLPNKPKRKMRKRTNEISTRIHPIYSILDDEVTHSTEYALGSLNATDISPTVMKQSKRNRYRNNENNDQSRLTYISQGIMSISSSDEEDIHDNIHIEQKEITNEPENNFIAPDNDQQLYEYDPLELVEEIDYSEFITSLPDAIKETEETEIALDDLKAKTSMASQQMCTFKRIDCLIGKYYELFGINDYFDLNNNGLFLKYIINEELNDDDIHIDDELGDHAKPCNCV
eukprot:506848_1